MAAGAGKGAGTTPATDSRAWFLRRLNLFDGMSDEEIEEVGHMLRQRSCDPGDQIFEKEGDRLYLLKVGKVRLYRLTPDGQEVTTAVLRPGQLFGMGGMVGRPGVTLAEAIEPSVVCDASASHFLGVLAKHPLLMARVTMTMARQIFQLEETIERMGMHAAMTRVAAVLCDLAEDAMAETGEPTISMSQTQIAKLAGLTREAVARAIAKLRQDGVVSEGRPMRILDLQRLRAVVGSEQ